MNAVEDGRFDDPKRAALFDFTALFERDRARGAVRPLAEYQTRFPGLEAAIAREYERLTRAPTAGPGPAEDRRRIGPFLLLEVLGHGGQSVVHLALDTRLGRRVALKVLAPAAFRSEAALERFRREAAVLGRLSHPGICEVHEADFAEETPFIAMRYVPGRTLLEEVQAVPSGEERVRRAVRLVERAARALHAVHEAGVVHRDVKPSNVLVTPDGDPVLVDFGLARGLDADTLTEPEAVFGTAPYLAPEHFAGRGADRLTDVYALGVTLFELLTGRRPFEAGNPERLAALVLHEPAPDPAKRNPQVPVDLGVVVRKALEKDPRHRYQSALEFAEDLRRVREYEPVQARRNRPLVRLRAWIRRRPVLASSTILSAVLLSAGLVVALVLLADVREGREAFRALFLATEARRLTEVDPSLALRVAVTAAELRRNRWTETALYETLAASREEAAAVRVQGGRSVALSPSGDRAAFVIGGECTVLPLGGSGVLRLEGPAGALSVAFDPKGSRILLGGEGGRATLHDARGRLVRGWRGLPGPVDPVLFAGPVPYGLAGGRAFRLAGGDPVEPGAGHGTPFAGLAAAGPDRLLALGRGGRLHLFLNGRCAGEWGPRVRRFTPSPNRELLALERPGRVEVHRLGGGAVLPKLAVGDEVHSLALSPGGDLLALGFRGRVAVHELPSGRLLFSRATHGRRIVWTLAFSPGGRRLATGGLDGTVRIFAMPNGRPLDVLHGKWPHIVQLRWLDDGEAILSVASNRRVRLHRLTPRPGMYVLDPGGGAVRDAVFSAEGKRFYAACADGRVRVFAAADGRLLRILEGGAGALLSVAVRADGAVLASAEEGEVLLWPAGSATPVPLETGRPFVLARFLASGRILAVGRDGLIRLRSLDGTSILAERPPNGEEVGAAALHEGAGLLVLGRRGPVLESYALGDLAPVSRVEPASTNEAMPEPRVLSLAFAPGGERFAAGTEDMVVRLFETKSLAQRMALVTPTPGPIRFSPDGRTLAVGARHNPRVLCFTLPSGARVYTGAEHGNRISSIAFPSSGEAFATASFDGSVHLHALPGGGVRAVLDGHRDAVAKVLFDPAGRSILSVSFDGTIRLRPVDPLPLARTRLVREFTEREAARLGSALPR